MSGGFGIALRVATFMSVKILTVDDSRTIRAIIARTLKRFDCVFCEAENGEQGLAVATGENPNLIILDDAMPVMDGATMLGKLREDDALKNIPVMMLTADTSPEYSEKNIALGAGDCLVKPFKDSHFIERVCRLVPLAEKIAAPPGMATV
jgi:two-component system, cell cycle response regulator